MFLRCERFHYSLESPCYDQVLTGILPYGDSDRYTIAFPIIHGVRPSRPPDLIQGKWLQDPVWNVITTGWSEKPEQRCELPVMHHIFLASSITIESIHFEQPSVKVGVLLEQLGAKEESPLGPGSQNQVPEIETGRQQRGNFILRIASFFQFLRDSEPEIERRVNEMDKAVFLPSTPSNPKADMGRSV